MLGFQGVKVSEGDLGDSRARRTRACRGFLAPTMFGCSVPFLYLSSLESEDKERAV